MIILWGKPSITMTNVSGSSANLTIPDIVADSTRLSTQAGDKHTADIEGGGYEAIRYDKNSFLFEFSVRFAAGRTMPLEDISHDGVINGTVKLVVTSTESGAPSMTINEAQVRYEDDMNADDGALRHYFFESIIPASGDQITWSHTAPAGQ